jgi:DNA-binding transcriptional MerR regulator
MEQRYTMGQVAKDAGVGKNTLAKWEQANHVPAPKRERGGNHARSYTAEERAKVLEYAACRKQLVDVSSLPPRATSGVGEQKTA